MLDLLYEKLFNSAPVPLIVTDSEGIIKLANEQAATLLDNKSTPLKGLHFGDFIDQSFLKSYFNDHSFSSFNDVLATYKTAHNHWIKTKEGTSLYTDIKVVTLQVGDENFHVWTFDSIEMTKKLTYDLNERVKEQLSILNVIELCFQSQDLHTTLQRCLQPIREGWQFPELTEVRVTLSSGEEFATDKFQKTEWCLQAELITANEHYGYLEVCYRHSVPTNGGKIFLYEEERLITVLGKIIGTIIEHWYSSKRTNEAIVDAQEEERHQIGMELHDNVQQILTAASINVDFLETIIKDGVAEKPMRNLKQALSEAIQELRRLSQQLTPSLDPDFPLTEKIHFLTNSLSEYGRLKVKTDIDPGIVLYGKVQLGFYRIIQEQLTNILKHAKTAEVEISIKIDEPAIVLRIADEGVGFDVSTRKRGIGFENIRRRTELMNGVLQIHSAPGMGTHVIVKVPKAGHIRA